MNAIDLVNFSELISYNPGISEGYCSLDWEAFNEDSQQELKGLFQALGKVPDANLFSAKVEFGSIIKVYGFTLAKEGDKVFLACGNNAEHKFLVSLNEQFVCNVGSLSLAFSKPTSSDLTLPSAYLVGVITVHIPPHNVPQKVHLPIYGKYSLGTNFDKINSAITYQSLLECLETFGGQSFKLVDFVRDPNKKYPIDIPIESWQFIPPQPGKESFGESLKLSLMPNDLEVRKEDGTTFYAPQTLYMSVNSRISVAARLLKIPKYAEEVSQKLSSGYKLVLRVTSPNNQKPLEYCPNHILVLVDPPERLLADGNAAKVLASTATEEAIDKYM